MQIIIIVLIIFILIFLIFCFIYAWYILRKAIYANYYSKDTPTPEKYKLKYETRKFKTEDGISLEGWYIPTKNPKATLIVVHAGYHTKATTLKHARYLYNWGYSTFFIDLRSDYKHIKYTYGVQEWRDVVAAYEYMNSLPENKNKKIGFFAGSMGAITSIVAAGITGKGSFIVASVPHKNLKSLFAFYLKIKRLPFFLLPFLQLAALIEFGQNYWHYAADRHISKIKQPIFIMSAKHDKWTDPNDAKYLFDLANEPKMFWQADTHHDIIKDDPEGLKKHIRKFLSEVTKK